jgi:hypothetical protein
MLIFLNTGFCGLKPKIDFIRFRLQKREPSIELGLVRTRTPERRGNFHVRFVKKENQALSLV